MLFNRERALEFMTEFGLDALLATTRHNVLYLSGFQGWAQYTYGDATTETFAIFFRDTGVAPALIVSRQDETYYSATGSWIEDVRGYGPRSALDIEPGEQGATDEERNYLSLIGEGAPREANSVDALVRVLSERGISTGNIAIDNEGIRPASRASLEAAFPDISFHDGANLFRLIRLQKTAEEVERLRAAATLNEEALSAFHAELAVGKTEREIASHYYRIVAAGGGKWSWFHLGGGRRSASIFPPSERPFQADDGFFFDAGMRLEHYCGDVGCCGSFGEPGVERKAQWDAIQAGLKEAFETIRAGVKPSEIFRAAVAGARKAGLPNYNGAFCGHTIGIEARELPYTLSEPTPLTDPFLPESSDIPLPAGAVLSVELPSGKFGEGGVHAEYTVLVTETGMEHLGAAKRKHFVV
ncbi:MAG: Xaa-Pro peptidase family protein [Nitrospinota bacterium]|nr:Xaa-Pro peptidase family protein [Nitrospinota bacterium]MDP7371326.1 Xaa-Pro peptidase family protein [Nitrospinota bacterium]